MGYLSSSYTYELCAIYGDVMTPKTEKNAIFGLVIVSFLIIETSEIPQLKPLASISISSSYTDEL